MKDKIKAVHGVVESGVKIFNLVFFTVSACLWVFLAVRSVFAHGFDFGALWASFNLMYDTTVFKVSCIFLIIFNGLGAARAFLGQYMDLAEGVQHGDRFRKFLLKCLGRGA